MPLVDSLKRKVKEVSSLLGLKLLRNYRGKDRSSQRKQLLGSHQEICEAEKELEHAQQLLNDFLNQNPTLSFIKDEAGRYLYASKSFFEFFKVQPQELLGKTDFEWLPKDLANHFTQNDELVRTTGKVLETIEGVQFPTGAVYSLVHKFPIHVPSGRQFVGGMATDITQRLKAEELSNRLAAIVEFSDDAIISSSPAGLITSWNKGAEKIYGYSADSILGKPFSLLIADSGNETLSLLERLNSGERIRHYETVSKTKDGKEIFVSLTASPIFNSTNQAIASSIIIRDITEHKLAQKEIEQLNEKLEARIYELKEVNAELLLARDEALEASNLKSAFVANISHELRTPLSGVIGMNELLLTEDLTKEQRELAEAIQDSAQSLKGLVDDLLDLAKIEAGKLALENIVFNVITLVQDSTRVLIQAAQKKQLILVTEIDQRIPLSLVGDPLRIQQVLLNLIGNSIKFTEKGMITVKASLIAENADMASVRFAVTDTGIGISEDELRLLFKPFVQIDSSTTRKQGGTGLGLAISKQFVEMMNGRMGVESTKGHGSNFWFSIPFKRSHNQNVSWLNVPFNNLSHFPSLTAGKLILVVEDSPVIQNLAFKQLINLGIQAQIAANGSEAIAMVRDTKFDLILMDCHLPEVNGYEATKKIRELEKISGHHTPIIAMTAGAMKGDAEKCIAAGMDDYLSKPVSLKQLRQKLQQWLSLEVTCDLSNNLEAGS